MAFARGTHSRGICERCGFEYAYLEIKEEPGTKLDVCPECYDGSNNRVTDPLNYPPKDVVDRIALRDPNPDRDDTQVGPFVFAESSAGFGTKMIGWKKIQAPTGEDKAIIIPTAQRNFRVKGFVGQTTSGTSVVRLQSSGVDIAGPFSLNNIEQTFTCSAGTRVSAGKDLSVVLSSAAAALYSRATIVYLEN